MSLFWVFIVFLIILWIVGFSFHIGGSLIHLILIVVLCALAYHLASAKKVT